jgi:hypothetical protein
MKPISPVVLLPLLLWHPLVMAQTTPPGMTMHRSQTGDLDASGWALATSTSGGFSVKLPCLFNDFKVESAKASEPVTSVDTVGCLRQDQRKFSASRFTYRHGAKAAREYFEQMSKRAKWEGETSRADAPFKGLPTFQVNLQSSTRCGATRAVLAGSHLFLLVVEAPRFACDGLAEQAATFLSSLEIDVGARNPQMERSR